VASPKQNYADRYAAAEPKTLSAFVARVLNQLSLSAWLPGAFFVVSATLVAWFRANRGIALGGIGPYVEHNWVPILVLTLPALVITTLLTQAFSFEAIRSLEGYWRRRGPASWLRTSFIKRQLRIKNSLTKRYRAALAESFLATRPRLLELRVDGLVLLAVEADLTNAPRPKGLSKEQEKRADNLPWLDHCRPWDSAKVLRLRRENDEFPSDSRIMPTRLGNILRVAEDGLRNTGGDVEGFVMRNRGTVPQRILEHHDQFRTRLDMYCTLVIVAAALAAVSVPALWDLSPLDRIGVPVAFLITSWASYSAALSSARGYSSVLMQIDHSVGNTFAPTR
jgi:hypothetical protein